MLEYLKINQILVYLSTYNIVTYNMIGILSTNSAPRVFIINNNAYTLILSH